MKNQKKKNKSKFLILRLVFVFFLVVGNTFAWFIYATKVDNSVDVHVKAWNVVFEAGDHEVVDYVNLNVESVYPGMPDYEYTIQARNQGDVNASLSFQILEARVFDEEYKSVEAKQMAGEEVLSTDLTSAQLASKLSNDYPFSIGVTVSNDTIVSSTGIEYYIFSVVWPFESDNDEEDTRWGIIASNYKISNPDDCSIALKVRVVITQNNS